MATSANSSLGSLLRRYRLAATFSQEELAERSTVSVRTISDLERGIRNTARMDTVRLLADGLDLPPADRSALIAAATTGTAAHPSRVDGDLIRTHLPESPNRLIGRTALVEEIVSGFDTETTRLQTLTGPGGVGKTRVAIEAARAMAARQQRPAVFVPLAPVAEVRLVPGAIGQALGVSLNAASPDEQIMRFLARQRMLLVLDNMEHVVEAAPFIARLSDEAAGVLILVTSRARLRLSSERELHVQPLDLPVVGASDEEIRRSGAVRLFTERAAAASDQTDPVQHPPELVAEICRKLDGLPLGLELAATRLRVMPAGTLLEMLESRLPVLTGGPRDRPDRQQSMRAAIDWSYALLGPNQQALFRWLAVYVGGFSSDAVAHTGDAIGLGAIDAFDALEGLLDSGLMERDSESDRQPRFRMLETIREYGIAQLTERGEFDDAMMAFSRFVYELVADGASLPAGELDPAWFARVEREDANVIAAFDWLCHPERAELAIAFCAAIGMYWEFRGPWDVVADRMRRAVSLAPLAPSLPATRALYFAAGFLMGTGDYATAKELGDIALRMSHDLGDQRAIAYSLGTLGWHAELREDWSEATGFFEQALAIWEELGERGSQGQMLMFLGGHAYIRADYATARRLQNEAASIFAGSDSAVDFLAATEWRLGCIDAAEQLWHDAAVRALRSLELWLTTPTQNYLFQPIILMADVAAALAEFEIAATLLGCGDHLLETIGGVLFSHDKPGWDRATDRCRTALGEMRFAQHHDAAPALSSAAWLELARSVAEKSALGVVHRR
ncbi:MAG: helix-turn-helix domain-containing protein [Thermomicrobiales bacterium]|nr:helix-turn-helix domain-containing protein [Thermomicrobiales bacterium]